MDKNNFGEISVLNFPTLPSTNAYVKQHIDELSDFAVVTADIQTDGRGRLGNKWISDIGALSMSVLLKRADNPQNITVVSAVAICTVLKECFGISAYIKWTNDIICEKNKICGILCESMIKCSSDGKLSQPYIICGIGLNVNQSREFFVSGELPNGASLSSLYGREYDKNAIAMAIAKKLSELIRADFKEVLSVYKKLCITTGKMIKFIRNGEEIIAFAKDIDENGCLICENEDGEFVVNSGVVKVRGLNGEYV